MQQTDTSASMGVEALSTRTESCPLDANISEDEIAILARAISRRNLAANRDRLYMDPADGRLKLSPSRNYIRRLPTFAN